MTKNKAEELLRKYRLGTISEEERALLESWYNQQAGGDCDFELAEKEVIEDLNLLSERFSLNRKSIVPLPSRRYFKIALIAASLVAVVSIGVYFYQRNPEPPVLSAFGDKIPQQHDVIVPGDRKAILTLGDSTRVVLDNAAMDNISNQSGIKIYKTAEGKIVYTIEDRGVPSAKAVQYNTISTPSGGEYQIQLADGTNVWLNSLSSIRFPTSFSGNERRVEITGEAYFEVAHQAAMPFRVVGGGQVVEVLGTHFNVNAYKNEDEVKTTLFEGVVKVGLTADNHHRVLKPGEQSIFSAAAGKLRVQQIDTEQVLAWKSGYFIFDNDDLATVMKQLARWYDVDVSYQGSTGNLKFNGAIARKRQLTEVLHLLELSADVKFKIEGRRIIVML